MFIGGGQRRKCIGSIKRVAVLIAVVFVALIVDTASGRGIQAKAEDITSGALGNTNWSFDTNTGVLTLSPKAGTDGGLKYTDNNYGKWDFRKKVKEIKITNKIVIYDNYPIYLFNYYENMTKITGLANLDTSKVTCMDCLFSGCSALQSLDLSHFDTSNVTTMHDMFLGCSSLKSLDVSHFNTANVEKMDNMFYGCSSLTKLDLSNFNTSKNTATDGMFSDCYSLESINLKNFDTSSVNNMAGMFRDCRALKELDVSMFNTSRVTNMCDMFESCFSLTTLNLKNFNTSNVTNMSYMFAMFTTSSSQKLTSLLKDLNVSSFNTDKVTDMKAMFGNLKLLTALDISNFNTSNVVKMSSMFFGCESLMSIDISNFRTSNVTDMSSMFAQCKTLKAIDLSNFDTARVIDMRDMFFMGTTYDKYNTECSLNYINLSNFDTSTAIAKAKELLGNGKYYNPFSDMFNYNSSYGYPFTIVLGRKCNTSIIKYKDYGYKFGIQYELPYNIYQKPTETNKKELIIQHQENKKTFKYKFVTDYNDPLNEHVASNEFADAWKPDMAGTWTVVFKDEPATEYTVTFKDSLTNDTISSSKVNTGTNVELPTPPVHDGYEFVKWQNKDKLTNIQSDITVIAIYKKIEKPVTKYTVIFKDGLTNSIISSSTVDEGTNIAVPAVPSHDGYRFVSWLNVDKLSNVKSDVTVIAQYEKIDTPKKQYTITFKDSVTGKVIFSIRAEEGASVIVPATPKHDGYEFISWDNKDKLTNIQSDAIVTAIYKKIEKPATKYTVIFKDGLANTVISSSVVEEGANVSAPTAPEHDGYEFVSWDNEDKLTNIQSDVTIIATYKKIEKPDNQSKQTVLPVKSDDNNQTISNQPNELEQTGISLPSLLVPLSAILSVALIAYYRRRSK